MPSDDTQGSSFIDNIVPATLSKLDAFPKVPTAYKARSESRGFMTLIVGFLGLFLILNDIGEYIWGWPDFEFSVDPNKDNFMTVNIDMVVAMPCGFLSVDLRDAMGDRLMLSNSLARDGVKFDVGQATALQEHTAALSISQAVSQSRNSRGFFSMFSKSKKNLYRPTYKHEGAPSACRLYGTLPVKRVMSNLHITTLGHGYTTYEHVDHNQMNLSHVISEFSFGPHFPEISQPLDNSYEATHEHFISYQYFLHIVPTTYIAPRTAPLKTNQYSVTHYTRLVEHDRGTPGIFFKFELDPIHITAHQRTPTFIQLFTRCVGVLGGVFICMGYAIRVTTRAVEVVTGADAQAGLVAAESSGVKAGLRAKWGGGELRSRGKLVPQGAGWTVEGSGSPYSSYTSTPVISSFSPSSPYLPSPSILSASLPGSPNPGGPSYPPPPVNARSVSGPSSLGPPRTPAYPTSPSPYGGSSGGSSPIPSAATLGSNAPDPYSISSVPPTPGAGNGLNGYNGHNGNGYNGNGHHQTRSPSLGGKKDD